MSDSLSLLDYIFIITIGLSVFWGLLKGFTRSFLGIVGFIFAIYATFTYPDIVAPWIKASFATSTLIADITAPLAIFLSTIAASSVLIYLIYTTVERIDLGGVDRLAGAIFGLARGALISAVMIFFILLTPFVSDSDFRHNSVLLPKFIDLGISIVTHLYPHQKIIDLTPNIRIDLRDTTAIYINNRSLLTLQKSEDVADLSGRYGKPAEKPPPPPPPKRRAREPEAGGDDLLDYVSLELDLLWQRLKETMDLTDATSDSQQELNTYQLIKKSIGEIQRYDEAFKEIGVRGERDDSASQQSSGDSSQ